MKLNFFKKSPHREEKETNGETFKIVVPNMNDVLEKRQKRELEEEKFKVSSMCYCELTYIDEKGNIKTI